MVGCRWLYQEKSMQVSLVLVVNAAYNASEDLTLAFRLE
jgi:hypothetical protein